MPPTNAVTSSPGALHGVPSASPVAAHPSRAIDATRMNDAVGPLLVIGRPPVKGPAVERRHPRPHPAASFLPRGFLGKSHASSDSAQNATQSVSRRTEATRGCDDVMPAPRRHRGSPVRVHPRAPTVNAFLFDRGPSFNPPLPARLRSVTRSADDEVKPPAGLSALISLSPSHQNSPSSVIKRDGGERGPTMKTGLSYS